METGPEPSAFAPFDEGSITEHSAAGDRGFVSAYAEPDQRERLTVAAIWFFAILLRFFNLLEIRDNDPFFRNPSVDPLFYHDWAVQIANGDVLGQGVFLQGPLYPYLLSILYWIAGPNLLLPRFISCVLGSLVCVMVWRLARELFGRRTALVACAMSAGYGLAIFYEGSLLIANLLLPLSVAIAWFTHKALRDATPLRWAMLGGLIGITALARPNMLLYAPFAALMVFVLLPQSLPFSRKTLLAACLVVGTCFAVAPAALRNYVVAGDPVLISASAGMNFFNGNNPDANGTHNVPRIFDRSMADHPLEQNRIYKAYAEEKLGKSLKASEVSSYWLGRGLDYVAKHPVDWIKLLGLKVLLFTNAQEIWNNRSFELSRQFSWVLRLPLLNFAIVGPLALLGFIVTASRWRRLLPLYGIIGVYFATCVLFFVLSRYRVPAIPILTVFAAAALVWLYDAMRMRRVAFVVAAIALVVLAVGVNQDRRTQDLSVAYYNLGNKYRASHQYEKAIAQYRKSLEINDHYISAHNNLAISFEKSGKHREEAIESWRRLRAMALKRGLSRYVDRAERHLRDLDAH